jgi:hypothetical protein
VVSSETAEQKSAKLARNVHWMFLYQICVFGADLKSNMAARDRVNTNQVYV